MKRIKQIVPAILLTFVMLLSLFPQTLQAEETGNYLFLNYVHVNNETDNEELAKLDGAVINITQTAGAYDPIQGVYQDASLASFDVKFDAAFDTSQMPAGTEFTYLDVGQIKIKLPEGTYKIKEKTPAPGCSPYKLKNHGGSEENDSIIIELPQTVTETGSDGAVISKLMREVTVNFKVIDTRVSVEVTKQDGDNNLAALGGAVFRLRKWDEEAGKYIPFDMDEKTDGVQSDLVSSAEDGKLVYQNLNVGKYQLAEIAVPEGYTLNNTTYEFEVLSTDTDDSVDPQTQLPKFKFNHVNYRSPKLLKEIETSNSPAEANLSVTSGSATQYFERNKLYEYRMNVDLPADIASYKRFILQDRNQNEGEIAFTEVTSVMIGDKDVSSAFDISTQANLISLTGKTGTDAWNVMTPGKLVVKFKAKFTADSEIHAQSPHGNSFTLQYTNQWDYNGYPPEDPDYPPTPGETPPPHPDEPHESNTVNSDPMELQLKLTKTKSDGITLLGGAEFELKPIEGRAFETALRERNTRKGENKIVTTEDNAVVIKGLDAGVYELTETKAPEGYRLLDKAIRIELSYDNGEDGTADAGVVTEIEQVVKNFHKDEYLPNTGTQLMLFYALIGGAAVGAGLLLKKKKDKKS